ncbi:MAG: LPS export ABC transporter ATP-binding protein [Bacteroidales bacterium]|nr:LPS export ABC transporter ATP-binding protein [Bacteroidales bacterium]
MQYSKMQLRTENVVKIYRSRTVVKEVSVSVQQGEIVGLLGPNGAGKTTTFYMIVGIIKPFSGRVFLDDMEITKMPMYRRAQLGVGYLAQEASVFRHMTVEDNIMAILQFRKDLDKAAQQEKLESLISEFGLEKIRRSKGIQLSGGERRRTEIARALANDPKFLLLDEPFAGVDPIAVQDIQDIVAHLKDRNIGILITDHNVHETLSITDRAYLLYEGSVLHHGTPEEMAADPDVREKYLGRDFELRRATTRALNDKAAEKIESDSTITSQSNVIE